MNAIVRDSLGLKADEQDKETTDEVIRLLRKKNLTVDRASRILSDVQIMLP